MIKVVIEKELGAMPTITESEVVDIHKLRAGVQDKYIVKIELECKRRKTWPGAVIILTSHKSNDIWTHKNNHVYSYSRDVAPAA